MYSTRTFVSAYSTVDKKLGVDENVAADNRGDGPTHSRPLFLRMAFLGLRPAYPRARTLEVARQKRPGNSVPSRSVVCMLSCVLRGPYPLGI